MASGSSSSVGPRSSEGQRLDRLKNLHAHQLPAWEGMEHFITYDRSSVHKPPQAPSSSPSSSTHLVGQAQRPRRTPSTLQEQQRVRKRIEQLYDDLPPLQQEEEDDEDFEDNRSLARFSQETNKWLLFAGVFALITTLFIVNFSTLPHQAQQRRRSVAALQYLAQLSQQLDVVPVMDPTTNAVSIALKPFNLSGYLDSEPTLAMLIRDELVAKLWCTSLVFTSLAAMTVLMIKQWLMSCTLANWPSFYDSDPEDSLRDEERLRLRRPSAQRMAEMRKTRKETLRKTEKWEMAVPFLMYTAVGMFMFGVLARVGSSMWIQMA
ncbi:hypothetical protein BC835DRAFT_598092 [Cytidiella melzeri]|nr:hypothetical protein BC835DRAFT_598092 [Cytidiella melzeri]